MHVAIAKNQIVNLIKICIKDDNYVLEMFQCEMKNHEYDLTHDDKEVIEACGLDMFEMNSSQRLRLLYIQAKKSFLSLCYD